MSVRRASIAQELLWRLEALGFDLLGLLFKIMPLEAASRFGGAALLLLGPLSRAHKTADRNLRIAFPDLDSKARQRLLVAQWDNLGRLTAEFQLMHKLTPASGRIEIVGGERLRAVAAKLLAGQPIKVWGRGGSSRARVANACLHPCRQVTE